MEHGPLQNGLNAEMSMEMLLFNACKLFQVVGTIWALIEMEILYSWIALGFMGKFIMAELS